MTHRSPGALRMCEVKKQTTIPRHRTAEALVLHVIAEQYRPRVFVDSPTLTDAESAGVSTRTPTIRSFNSSFAHGSRHPSSSHSSLVEHEATIGVIVCHVNLNHAFVLVE